MTSFELQPRQPTKYWPLEVWLRRFAVIGGLALMRESKVNAFPFLVGLAVVGTAGYLAALWSAGIRRRRMDDPIGRLYYHDDIGRGASLRLRWQWRLAWLVAFVYQAAQNTVAVPLAIASLWSMGWMIAEFVDRRSAAGETEWKRWSTDLEEWNAAAAQRRVQGERSWAAAFPTYKAYQDARSTRDGEPLTHEEFFEAKKAYAAAAPADTRGRP